MTAEAPSLAKEIRSGRSQGNLARTPDVAVVIHLNLVSGPCGRHRYHTALSTKHWEVRDSESERERESLRERLGERELY